MNAFISRHLPTWSDSEEGQSVIEYALVVGVVSAALVGVLGLAASTWLNAIVDSVTAAISP